MPQFWYKGVATTWTCNLATGLDVGSTTWHESKWPGKFPDCLGVSIIIADRPVPNTLAWRGLACQKSASARANLADLFRIAIRAGTPRAGAVTADALSAHLGCCLPESTLETETISSPHLHTLLHSPNATLPVARQVLPMQPGHAICGLEMCGHCDIRFEQPAGQLVARCHSNLCHQVLSKVSAYLKTSSDISACR